MDDLLEEINTIKTLETHLSLGDTSSHAIVALNMNQEYPGSRVARQSRGICVSDQPNVNDF